MKIEWNPETAAVNLRKHGIDFAEAAVAHKADRAETRQYYKGVRL